MRHDPPKRNEEKKREKPRAVRAPFGSAIALTGLIVSVTLPAAASSSSSKSSSNVCETYSSQPGEFSVTAALAPGAPSPPAASSARNSTRAAPSMETSPLPGRRRVPAGGADARRLHLLLFPWLPPVPLGWAPLSPPRPRRRAQGEPSAAGAPARGLARRWRRNKGGRGGGGAQPPAQPRPPPLKILGHRRGERSAGDDEIRVLFLFSGPRSSGRAIMLTEDGYATLLVA